MEPTPYLSTSAQSHGPLQVSPLVLQNAPAHGRDLKFAELKPVKNSAVLNISRYQPTMPFNLPEPTRLPLRPGQPTMSSIPMRPSMPIPMDEHLHRSMPTPPSPYDMDQRDSRVMSPPFETRLGLEGPEYFSAMGAAGPFGPRYHQGVPFPPGLEPEAMMGGHPQYIDELVRR